MKYKFSDVEQVIKDAGICLEIIDFNTSNIDNIYSEEHISYNGNKFAKWFIILNDNSVHPITRSRKDILNIQCKLYCTKCNKELSTSSNFFNAAFLSRNNTKLVINDRCHKFCKNCATSINGKKGNNKQIELNNGKHFFQTEEFKNKSIQTKIDNYGDDWKKLQMQRCNDSFFNKTGYTHNSKDPIIRAKMVNTWKETISNKPIAEIKEWHLKSFSNKGKSKLSDELLDNLNLYFDVEKEFFVDGKYLDGYIKDKCIIEFLGDYWHANPEKYNENEEIKYPGGKLKTAKSIWEKDKNRFEFIQSKLNEPIILIWEKDYLCNKESILIKLISFVKQIHENNICEQIITIK